MPRKKTTEEVLCEFKKAHGDYYNYSKVVYKNSSTKVDVNCPVHGLFKITPCHHKSGVGCRKCYFDAQKITKAEFVNRAKEFFGERYDYSRFDALPPHGKMVSILCIEHNEYFLQEPKNHMRGHTGCPKCKSLKLSGMRCSRGSIKSGAALSQEFERRAIEVHGDVYDYSQFEYTNSGAKGKITCLIHGAFLQTPSNHLKGHKCPKCAAANKKSGSFKNLCVEKGCNYYRALKRRQAGLSDSKIFEEGLIRSSRKVNEINVFDESYPNLEDAVRVLRPVASSTTISRWIGQGLSPEEAFERMPNPGYAEGLIYVVVNQLNGKQYVGLTIQTLERRWSCHIEQALASKIKDGCSLHAAIRRYGEDAFSIGVVDKGISKKDLEVKECKWIKKLDSLVPNGYNISAGGVSGGSNKKPTTIDGIRFCSVRRAAEYVAESRGISVAAAKRRILNKKVDVRTPAKPGKSLVKTKVYKAWSRIIHGALNPKSKDYIPGLAVHDNWREFASFYKEVGDPPEAGMAFTRLVKQKGFYPENCVWLTKSEASKINAA